MKILFSNATVITVDTEDRVLYNAFVVTEGETISSVTTQRPEGTFDREIDCTGKVLMPGLVNAHTHIPMTLMRGFAGGHDLKTWLNDYIFPTEAKLDGRTVQAGSLLALAEMIASGTTAIGEMYYFCDDIAKAVQQAGISANISRSVTIFEHTDRPEDYPSCQELRQLVAEFGGTGDDQIVMEASIHAEYTSFLCPEMWQYLADYARENGLGMQIHLSETLSEHQECMARHNGKTPAQVMDDYGVWNTRALAAHCVHLSDEDMVLLAQRGVHVIHNPVSNLKLGSGIARVPAMMKAGLNVALGTDGASSNNNLDLFEEVKLAATLHGGVLHDPTAVTPMEAIRMATANGAKALGRHTGVIAPGYMADVILLDFDQPHLMPCHDPVENVVFCARGSDVSLTMARGKVLYEGGRFTSLDLDAVKHEVETYAMPRLFS